MGFAKQARGPRPTARDGPAARRPSGPAARGPRPQRPGGPRSTARIGPAARGPRRPGGPGADFPLNKLTSVFYASVLLLIMNFVITLSK